MDTKPTGMPEIDGNSFEILVRLHTNDGIKFLSHEEKLRMLLGEKLDSYGLQEEIDYTLEVYRVYRKAGFVRGGIR